MRNDFETAKNVNGTTENSFPVKTKNRFYSMRSTLDRLQFNVVKLQPDLEDSRESKLYLSKRIAAELLRDHRTKRSVRFGDEADLPA